MKPIICKSTLMLFFIGLCLIVFSWQIPAQQNIGRQTILQFDASSSVFRPDALPLLESIPMEHACYYPVFVSGVGGVSFDQVAQPVKYISVRNVKLDYNKNEKDGKRLELLINYKVIKVHLPDWMLIPIAKYADSYYYSCITLFGKLDDKVLEKEVIKAKGRVINYHPAFDDRLIGIRLAYMDMLVGYSFTTDLPKNSDKQYILGAGEDRPNLESNKEGAYYLSRYMTSIQNKYRETFRSYIISDYSQRVVFSLVRDSLVLSSYPYFYCWRFNSDRKDYDINKVAQAISSNYNRVIEKLGYNSGSQSAHNWALEKLITLTKRYKNRYGFYSEGTFIDLLQQPTDAAKKKFLEKYSFESIFKMIVNTEAYMDKDSVVYLKNFSDDVSSKPDLFRAANPSVWNATVNTMRYSAFFRYIKYNYADTWFAFMNKIRSVDPEPRIVTPTIMVDSENKDITRLIKKKGR